MELVSLKQISVDSKVNLLKELGYGSDGEFVTDSEGNKVESKEQGERREIIVYENYLGEKSNKLLFVILWILVKNHQTLLFQGPLSSMVEDRHTVLLLRVLLEPFENRAY